MDSNTNISRFLRVQSKFRINSFEIKNSLVRTAYDRKNALIASKKFDKAVNRFFELISAALDSPDSERAVDSICEIVDAKVVYLATLLLDDILVSMQEHPEEYNQEYSTKDGDFLQGLLFTYTCLLRQDV